MQPVTFFAHSYLWRCSSALLRNCPEIWTQSVVRLGSVECRRTPLLSEFRDYFTEAARPATASTIAFSTLVSELKRAEAAI